MKNTTGLLMTVLLTATTSWAQSLQELNSQYEPLSPLPKERIETEETLDPNASYLTPAEEQLAELKEKEEQEKTALDERLYLDTDFRFFQTLNLGLEADELDHAYQQLQASKNISDLTTTEKIVKTELKTSHPQTKPLTQTEGLPADTRREFVLKKIGTNVKSVKSCITQNRRENEVFKGSELTLSWQVNPDGKVLNPQVKASDLESSEIKNCILKSIAELNFSDSGDSVRKASHIEYTYRFTSEAKKEMASK